MLIVSAMAVGVAAAVAYRRFATARTFLTVLAPAPLVFLALFLFASPVSRITLSPEAEAHAATTSARAPVVMVVFDEFPLVSLLDETGEIDAARYPNFAELAAGSTWFSRTFASTASTMEAVPSLLTGKDPEPGRLPFFRDHPDNLFTILGGSHRLVVVEPMTSLCPQELCPREAGGVVARQRRLLADVGVVYGHVLLPDDLGDRLPPISSTWMDFRNTALHDMKDRDDEFRAFVNSIAPTDRPTVWFVHTLLPHHPWRYLPSGAEYARATLVPGLRGDRWGSDAELVAQAQQRHLLQVGFVDRLLGELLDRLRATGVYDRSLLVVTADHGVSFRPNGDRRRLTEANRAEAALVPLFVKAPSQRKGRIVGGAVRTADVLPTVADLLGIEIPWDVDGRSGFDAPAGPPRELENEIAAALARKHVLFGSALYRVGPRLDLLGRRVADLPVAEREGLASAVIPPEAGLSPAHVVGVLAGDKARPGLDIAVAVNGTVAATARTFSFAGDVRFEAMIPESAFAHGDRDVRVYVVTTAGELLTTRGRP